MIEHLPIEEVKLNDKNPRTISTKKLEQLIKSIKEFPEMLEPYQPGGVFNESEDVEDGERIINIHDKEGNWIRSDIHFKKHGDSSKAGIRKISLTERKEKN